MYLFYLCSSRQMTGLRYGVPDVGPENIISVLYLAEYELAYVLILTLQRSLMISFKIRQMPQQATSTGAVGMAGERGVLWKILLRSG